MINDIESGSKINVNEQSRKISRRKFLGLVGLAGGGLAATTLLAGCNGEGSKQADNRTNLTAELSQEEFNKLFLNPDKSLNREKLKQYFIDNVAGRILNTDKTTSPRKLIQELERYQNLYRNVLMGRTSEMTFTDPYHLYFTPSSYPIIANWCANIAIFQSLCDALIDKDAIDVILFDFSSLSDQEVLHIEDRSWIGGSFPYIGIEKGQFPLDNNIFKYSAKNTGFITTQVEYLQLIWQISDSLDIGKYYYNKNQTPPQLSPSQANNFRMTPSRFPFDRDILKDFGFDKIWPIDVKTELNQFYVIGDMKIIPSPNNP